MARGQFLQDLSSGIFDRLGQIRQEQEATDAQSKASLINMLAGLADKIEPEGLPMLMGHIWDTMGIKKQATGKGLRGFLDAFSGVPNRSVEDQIGTKFKELTDSFVGPQTAKDVRLRGNIANKGIPGLVNPAVGGPGVEKARADMEDLRNKMVFRDPFQQKLDEIEARYSAQTQAAIERSTYDKALANKFQTERDDANRKGRINQIMTKHMLDAQKPLDRLAWQYYYDDIQTGRAQYVEGMIQPPMEYQSRASQELQNQNRLKIEDTRNKMKNRDKQGNYYDAQVNALRVGKPENRLARERFDEQKYTAARKTYESFTKADTEMTTQKAEAERVGKILQKYADARNQRNKATGDNAVTFDEKLGTFVGPGAAGLNIMYEDIVKKYGDALKKRTSAEGVRRGFADDMKSAHEAYVEAGENDTYRLRGRGEFEGGKKTPVRPQPPKGKSNQIRGDETVFDFSDQEARRLGINDSWINSTDPKHVIKGTDGTRYRIVNYQGDAVNGRIKYYAVPIDTPQMYFDLRDKK